MEKLLLNWDGPFRFHERISSIFIGAIGLYVLEHNSTIYYVGKTEEHGGIKRAKDHLRGQMDKIGRCVFEKAGAKNKNEINIWFGWIDEEKARPLINDGEKLLIYDCDPECNDKYRGKYQGGPVRIINRGNYPPSLHPEI
jgi:hypothetical protein